MSESPHRTPPPAVPGYFARVLRPAALAPRSAPPRAAQAAAADIVEVDEVVTLSSRGETLAVHTGQPGPGEGRSRGAEMPAASGQDWRPPEGALGQGLPTAESMSPPTNPIHHPSGPGAASWASPATPSRGETGEAVDGVVRSPVDLAGPKDSRDIASSGFADFANTDFTSADSAATPGPLGRDTGVPGNPLGGLANTDLVKNHLANKTAQGGAPDDAPAMSSDPRTEAPAAMATGNDSPTPEPQALLQQVLRWVARPAPQAVQAPAPESMPVVQAPADLPPQPVHVRNPPPAVTSPAIPSPVPYKAGPGKGVDGAQQMPEEDLLRISIGDIQVRVTPPAPVPARPVAARAAPAPLAGSGLRRRCIHL